jgi:exonuclease V gamma subunit
MTREKKEKQEKEEKPELHVDDDWKAQAQAEKAQHAHEDAEKASQRGPLPPANFTLLVISLATQARMCLGDIEDPQSGKKQVDVELAKHNIDLLGMLEEKTQGNLSEQEKKLLDSVLYELRMRYVQLA